MRNRLAAFVVLVSLFGSIVAWSAATQCSVNNNHSSPVTVEIRTGKAQNCLDNEVWWTGTIAANDSVIAPYGGNISKVCVRKSNGSSWSSNWSIAHCPSDDNASCKINL